jgi:hypothetical protein
MAQSWIGIRVSAALAILGSVVTLLMAAGSVWAGFYASDMPRTAGWMLIVLALFFVALTFWGVITGVGVLRHRQWARVSMVIFAVLLVGMGVSAVIGVFFIRAPDFPGYSLRNARLAIGAVYAGLAGIGAWWLMLFNSARAMEYFKAPPRAPTMQWRSRR